MNLRIDLARKGLCRSKRHLHNSLNDIVINDTTVLTLAEAYVLACVLAPFVRFVTGIIERKLDIGLPLEDDYCPTCHYLARLLAEKSRAPVHGEHD